MTPNKWNLRTFWDGRKWLGQWEAHVPSNGESYGAGYGESDKCQQITFFPPSQIPATFSLCLLHFGILPANLHFYVLEFMTGTFIVKLSLSPFSQGDSHKAGGDSTWHSRNQNRKPKFFTNITSQNKNRISFEPIPKNIPPI